MQDPNGGGSGDPSCQSGWTLSDELNPNPARCATDGVAVPSIVVRSTPDGPLAALQGGSSAAGTALAVNSHYRFDDFSHADQPLVGRTTSGVAVWAIGTVGRATTDATGTAQIGPLPGNPCDDNNALVDLQFTSVPHP